ncbi:hypothetical protein CA51_39830 [Rosistilla oblonga]|uniref:PSP1 C-terminal domain-containing protein n=1 Tax=Rosistilla oblonga TaxID=2527990 RepID=A0A518IXA9_9BACT|nr:PSP1 domain-containing protein [Rosistilla oblonga]QDV14089.1 hypothetical protein CA51_39830 [Rosistilla oblonga]QDV57717.1 hypothetical protein Mal33_37300 [Rosistilla oblonga]
MISHYLVRTGAWGDISQHRPVDGGSYRRGDRVICETSRGLEIGEVVADVDAEASGGRILRRMTDQDELLQQRLERYKRKAVQECRDKLVAAKIDAVLLEVEQLFDGRTLYFHFLGETDSDVEAITNELADAYEQHVRSRHFAKLLREGCGPDCGTKEGGGCSGGCAVCVVASACSSTAKKS